MNSFLDLLDEYGLILKNHFSYFVTSVPSSWKKGIKGDILLIPGFGGTLTDLKSLGTFLNEKGYRIYILDALDWQTSSINSAVQEVKTFIKEHNFENLIIIGHSKGGLIARLVIADHKITERIKKVITIASPFGGTIYGYLQVFSLKELLPKNSIFRKVHLDDKTADKIVNIYPALDNNVIPNSSLELDKVLNIKLDIVGHTRILESQKLFTTIERHL